MLAYSILPQIFHETLHNKQESYTATKSKLQEKSVKNRIFNFIFQLYFSNQVTWMNGEWIGEWLGRKDQAFVNAESFCTMETLK